MTEEWRDIYDGTFQVSNTGKVRRNKPGPRNKPNIILRQHINHNGYMRVNLNKGILKNENIQHIRELRRAGNPLAEIAELFHVTPSAISKICLRQTWAHIA